MRSLAWSRARNVLCVRLDTIGDVLMSTPAIRALKEALPGRRVSLLTSSPAQAVGRLVPEIDEVLVYDPPWMKATPQRSSPAEDLRQIAELEARGFDAAVIFTVFSQNPLPAATMCYLAEIPLRLAHCRENPYQLLTDWVRDTEPESGIRHEVRRQLDLVSTVGALTSDEHLSLRVPAAASRRMDELLLSHGISPSATLALLHPGATAASRRWPSERFGAVADILSRAGIRVAFTGTAEEDVLVAEARAAMRSDAIDLAGTLGIADLAALVARADVLVTNNTGPAHVAAAVGTPLVDIYALTNPQHTPWLVASRVLNTPVPCANCYASTCPLGHHACLLGVGVTDVADAALTLLAEDARMPARTTVSSRGPRAL